MTRSGPPPTLSVVWDFPRFLTGSLMDPEFAEPELVYSWLNSLVQKVGEAGLVTLRITILEPDLSPMFDEASSLHIKTRRLEKIRLSLISSKAKGSYIKCEEYRAWPCQTSLT